MPLEDPYHLTLAGHYFEIQLYIIFSLHLLPFFPLFRQAVTFRLTHYLRDGMFLGIKQK